LLSFFGYENGFVFRAVSQHEKALLQDSLNGKNGPKRTIAAAIAIIFLLFLPQTRGIVSIVTHSCRGKRFFPGERKKKKLP
jgi:hypothetical protein